MNIDIDKSQDVVISTLSSPNIGKSQNWNKEIEKVIKDIISKSQKYHTLHSKIAISFANRYTILMFLLIILNPLSGTFSLISFIFNPFIFDILSSSISFISGIIASVIKFGKYNQISNAHKIASSRYMSLANNAMRQLILNKEDRINPDKYLEWLMSSYDHLYEASPLIPIEFIEENMILQVEKQLDKNKEQFEFSESQDINKYSNKMMMYEIARMKNSYNNKFSSI